MPNTLASLLTSDMTPTAQKIGNVADLPLALFTGMAAGRTIIKNVPVMSNGANIPSLHFRKDIRASGIMGKEVNNYTTTLTSAVLGKSIYESSKTIAGNNQ